MWELFRMRGHSLCSACWHSWPDQWKTYGFFSSWHFSYTACWGSLLAARPRPHLERTQCLQMRTSIRWCIMTQFFYQLWQTWNDNSIKSLQCDDIKRPLAVSDVLWKPDHTITSLSNKSLGSVDPRTKGYVVWTCCDWRLAWAYTVFLLF